MLKLLQISLTLKNFTFIYIKLYANLNIIIYILKPLVYTLVWFIYIYKPNYVNQTNKNTLVNFLLLTKLNYICLLNQT